MKICAVRLVSRELKTSIARGKAEARDQAQVLFLIFHIAFAAVL